MRSGGLQRTAIRRCFGTVFGSMSGDDRPPTRLPPVKQGLEMVMQRDATNPSPLPTSGNNMSAVSASQLSCPSAVRERLLGSNASATAAGSQAVDALAAPLVPRVLSWFKPNSAFHMPRVLEVLEERGVHPECCFPPLPPHHSSTTSSSSTKQQLQRRSAASSTATWNVKNLEVVGFSLRSPPSVPSTDGSVVMKTTFFVFADGGLVGWNASWDEMVWMRGLLSSSTHPAAAATESGSSSSGLPDERHVYQQRGSTPPSDEERSSTTSQRSFFPPTILGGLPAAPSSRRAPASTSPSVAVESMRYQLFLTLPMSERPDDAEPQEEQTFIDADRDRIVLADDNDIAKKLPFSYALVQSVRLDAMHTSLEPLVQVVKRWQQQLSVDGRLVCTLKNLRQAKTTLLGLNEALNFGHISTQTTPRVFWSGDFHSVRGYYRDACSHLEIDDRAASLKAQVESIDETLSYLHDEAHASENEWLTWIIIVLIAFEVLAALGVFERVIGLIIDVWSTDSKPKTEGGEGSDRQGN